MPIHINLMPQEEKGIFGQSKENLGKNLNRKKQKNKTQASSQTAQPRSPVV